MRPTLVLALPIFSPSSSVARQYQPPSHPCSLIARRALRSPLAA
jgi:hypothetical protein